MHVFLPRTIQARLILSHLLVSLISIALVSAYSGNILLNVARTQVEEHYEDVALVLSTGLEEPLRSFQAGQGSMAEIERVLSRSLSDNQVHYTLYLASGEAIVDSSGSLPAPLNPETTPELWQALQAGSNQPKLRHINDREESTLLLVVQVINSEQLYGVLRLDLPLELALNTSRQSFGLLIIAALLVALGMSAVGYLLSRNLAGPIGNIMRTADSISRGELGARVKAPIVPRELNRLAEAFNNMANRLQTYVNELRAFVANASHELRTPLTSIKLRVEALRAGALHDTQVSEQFLAEIEGEVDRLSRMVNDMLDLSRIEAGLETKQHILLDLAVITSEVYDIFKVRAERADIHLQSQIKSGSSWVLGNEDQLRRMLYNLVDNAIKYTPRGGSVELELDTGESVGLVCLRVKDTGFGIAAAQLPHIFERFYRVEATRPRYGPPQGSGLGLPIAKSIVEIHSGRIGVISQVGKGSTFWVELPAHQKS
ncbi:MAG: HAMP domain-containing histidine kinase [Anaerolineales bacterium]|nr:MAG: HAMP domain-containing histidine kinase [Anaerolineales bacterium]